MKTTFNLTTSSDDMMRFENREDLLDLMGGFDGVELMCFEDDTRGIIPRERVIGLHMSSFPYWLDFWNQDEEALLREFGSLQECERHYGGMDRDALLRRFRQDLKHAKAYGVEYVVFHVSDASIEESFTRRYRHSDREVIDATCELLNMLFAEEDDSMALLLENLWVPGFSFTDPEMTRSLLEGVRRRNVGIMLDTGHIMHTNTKLTTQEAALAYIESLLDAHADLCHAIRGMHLNQSLTSEYVEQMMQNPPALGKSYAERSLQMFYHAYAVDRHLPFTCDGVADLIKRIAPDYLTFEFITRDNAQHREYLARQWQALQILRGCPPSGTR